MGLVVLFDWWLLDWGVEMIVVFGYVKCDERDCEAQYDTQIELLSRGGQTTPRPINKPKGWYVQPTHIDPVTLCPKHYGASLKV